MTYKEYYKHKRIDDYNSRAVIMRLEREQPQTASSYRQRYIKDKKEFDRIRAITDRMERLHEMKKHIELFE